MAQSRAKNKGVMKDEGKGSDDVNLRVSHPSLIEGLNLFEKTRADIEKLVLASWGDEEGHESGLK